MRLCEAFINNLMMLDLLPVELDVLCWDSGCIGIQIELVSQWINRVIGERINIHHYLTPLLEDLINGGRMLRYSYLKFF